MTKENKKINKCYKTDQLAFCSKYKHDPKFQKLLAQEKLILVLTEQVSILMQNQKISRKELAKKINKTKRYITKFLRGNKKTTLKELSDIFFALKHEANFTFGKIKNE